MASRPIPQGRGQPNQPKNPPLATSLDIEFSYRQPQLPPGEQVVGSNPSFLAFTDDELNRQAQFGRGGRHPLDHSSPYAYDEEDEDGLQGGRRGSDDWWSESDGGVSQSEDDEDGHGGGKEEPPDPHSAPRGLSTAVDLDDGETPRPAHSTLPLTALPGSLGRHQQASLAAAAAARSSDPSSAPARQALRLSGSYGFPSPSSLSRTTSLPTASLSLPLVPGSPETERQTSTSILGPLMAVVSRRSSALLRRLSSSSSSTAKGELKPLLPTNQASRFLGSSEPSGSTSGQRHGVTSNAPFSPPPSLPLPSPSAISTRSTSSHARKTRRKRQLVVAYLTAGAALGLVGIGAGLAVHLIHAGG